MKKLWFISLACCLAGFTHAQNEIDALRFSQLHFGGTARFNSMGGAFGALGGDFSSLSTNPAGIGVYRRSEITFTPSFTHHSTSSDYLGTTADDSRSNVNIGNFGWVSTYNSEKSTGWVAGSFGIGHNRLADFYSRSTIAGTNTTTSLLDVYQMEAQGVHFEDIESSGLYNYGANLAWQTFLIDTFQGESNYITQIPVNGQEQNNQIETDGRIGETVISFGGNYENRLFLGGTIGISSIRYNRESKFTETLPAGDSTTFLTDFIVREKLRTRGNGYTLKFGAIYRLTDYLRIGGAIHSPTWMVLEDLYSTSMTANYSGGFGQEIAESGEGLFEYRLRTPYRMSGSIAGIYKKYGIISADVEYVDYSTARLSERYTGEYDFDSENDVIQDAYQSAVNVRVGTEIRLMPISLRAGFAYQGSPYKESVENDGSVRSYSFGIGYRTADFFLDFGYVLRQQNEDYYPYNPTLTTAAKQDRIAQSYQVTLGLKY